MRVWRGTEQCCALARYMMGLGAAAARPGAQIDIAGATLPLGPSFSIGATGIGSQVLKCVHTTRTSGGDDFDGSGPASAIAASLAAAINDPKNSFAGHVHASAVGAAVQLRAVAAGADVEVRSPPPGAIARGEWADRFEPAELQFVADWLGESCRCHLSSEDL